MLEADQFVLIAVSAAAALPAWLLTVLIERNAKLLGLMHAPSARASHVEVTPHGGGLAIAITVIFAICFLIPGEHWGIGAPLVVMALLGLLDDLYDLAPTVRLMVQTLIVGTILWLSGPLPAMQLTEDLALVGWTISLILLCAGLWWLNLFNFMDGIDGIAGSQAILLLLGALLVWQFGDPHAFNAPIVITIVATVSATAGFLLRNWSPARIFMGDVGSYALSLIIFAVAIYTLKNGHMSYQSWIIMPGAFVTDASVTLVRRIFRGERFWQGHRRHAYQQLSRWLGHQQVTILYCMTTAIWTVPLALVAQYWPGLAWPLALVAYLPLVVATLVAGGGSENETAR